jgi:hypothetical protein
MHDVTKSEVTKRLRRIEGQVGGLLVDGCLNPYKSGDQAN